MPIPLQCGCGRSLRVKDELAGRKVKCPDCAAVLLVPQPAPADEEEAAYELLSGAEEEARPRARRESADEEAVQTAPRPHRPAADDEEDPEVSRRQRRQREEGEQEEARRRERRRKEARREGERRERSGGGFSWGGFGTTNAGVVGGLIMIVIGVVWLVLGLAAGRIFFYPAVLMVLGVVAIIKGLSGGG